MAVELAEDKLWYSSRIYKSINPAAQAERRLDSRVPLPPHCPGDREKTGENLLEEWLKDAIESWGFGLPDDIGKLFHPNELGLSTIAPFVMQKLINARAEELGVYNPRCDNLNKFECTKKPDEPSNYYADVDSTVETKKLFCLGELPLAWTDAGAGRTEHSKTYYRDTPDEMHFEVYSSTPSLNRDECHDSFNRIIHSCDGLAPENPLNFKFGGRWVRGSTIYQLKMGMGHIKRIKEVPKKRPGYCASEDVEGGWRFRLQGSGFASWDFGQETILPSAHACADGARYVHSFDFHYFPTPHGGMEWQAAFTAEVSKHAAPRGVEAWARCIGVFRRLAEADITCVGLDKEEKERFKKPWNHDGL